MECETCGCTEFYKESGYFYCKECQTQSQEVREHVFQNENPNERSKVIKEAETVQNTKKSNIKLTSWECYNVVIHSLTEQLVHLGAAEKLKPIVKCLWFKYLEQLEVLRLDSNVKPKFQLINTKKDVEILYGTPKKKKRKRAKSMDSRISESAFSRREIRRRKSALAKAEYDQFSQQSTLEDNSLHNETLTSLKGTSDASSSADNSVDYNRYGIDEMKKIMSQSHRESQKQDITSSLKHHTLKYDSVTNKFKRGVYFLSPIKIYSILYLGLLINKDKIQLGHLFRYIREGHLNFNKYTDLFPDTYSSEFLNIQNNSKINVFSNKIFREVTAQLAVLLNVTSYIVVPNLVELCRRYCLEMNLPNSVFRLVKSLISLTEPQLKVTKNCKMIPNYEGRAMSMILFVLKLIFGFDGVTEFHLANYGQSLNERLQSDMFNIAEWLEYVGYRSLLMDKYHLPSSQLNGSEVNSDLLLSYIKSHNVKFESDIYLTREMRQHKELLTKIKDLQLDFSCNLRFPASQTPFLKYSKILLKSNKIEYDCAGTILKCDFTSNSIDFLLYPNKYLELINPNIELKNGGANDNWVIEKIKSYTSINNVRHENNNLIAVLITKNNDDEPHGIVKKTKELNQDPVYVQQQYYECRKHVFEENALHIRKISERVPDLCSNIVKSETTYDTHYNPYERYWIHLLNVVKLNKSDVDNFIKDHSVTFQILFNECKRIIEQDSKEFYGEFQSTELFLVFSAVYNTKNEASTKLRPKRYLYENLDYYVKQAESHW